MSFILSTYITPGHILFNVFIYAWSLISIPNPFICLSYTEMPYHRMIMEIIQHHLLINTRLYRFKHQSCFLHLGVLILLFSQQSVCMTILISSLGFYLIMVFLHGGISICLFWCQDLWMTKVGQV